MKKNKNNPRFLFASIDKLVNPPSDTTTSNTGSIFNCTEFLKFFQNTITDIRHQILQTPSIMDLSSYFELTRPDIVMIEAFSLVTLQELTALVRHMRPTTCALDPISNKLLKYVFSVANISILSIINKSLSSGIVPSALKVAVVKPCLKNVIWILQLLGQFPIFHF